MGSKESGRLGEDIACEYLKRKGYKLIERNYRTRYGEIDVIVKKEKTLVFVEVKYGSKEAYLRVNMKKFRRIALTARDFLRCKGDFKTNVYRIDVVAVSKQRDIVHFEDVAKDFWG